MPNQKETAGKSRKNIMVIIVIAVVILIAVLVTCIVLLLTKLTIPVC